MPDKLQKQDSFQHFLAQKSNTMFLLVPNTCTFDIF